MKEINLLEVISRPPSMKESEIVKEMNRRIKKFDDYESLNKKGGKNDRKKDGENKGRRKDKIG